MRDTQAEDRWLRDTRQAHRAAGEGYPVVEDAEGDDLESEGRDDEVVITDAQGRNANQGPEQPAQDDGTDDVDQEGAVEIEGH